MNISAKVRIIIAGMTMFFCACPGWAATFNASTPTELQNALTTASGNSEDDVVNVAAGTYNLSAPLIFDSSENYALTLSGAGKGVSILDGGSSIHILSVTTTQADASVLVQNISFQNSTSTGSGGALTVSTTTAPITVDNCEATDSTVTGGESIGGGASLTTDTGTITVISSEFLRNHSSGNVGGLYAGTNTGTCYFTNCTFEDNSVNNTGGSDTFGDGGGAMFYSGGAGHAVIRGNTFRNNSAAGGDNPDGGGLMAYELGSGSTLTLESNTFTGNLAGLGGGGCILRFNETLCTVTVINNTFADNRTSVGNGAGVLVHMNNGTLTYSDNIHTGNQAAKDGGGEGDGGGACINFDTGSATISGNTFASNQTFRNGGGLSIFTDTAQVGISGNVFYSNSGGNVGGGLSCATSAGGLNVLNNTFWNNSVSEDGGGLYLYMDQTQADVSLINNILWNDSPNELAYAFGSGSKTVTMTYSCVLNGSEESWFGTGCVSNDPLFVNTATGDFNLQWAHYPTLDETRSPCIDTGDPASPHDADKTRADMGAFAYEQIPLIPGDVNADGTIDLKDAVQALQVVGDAAD